MAKNHYSTKAKRRNRSGKRGDLLGVVHHQIGLRYALRSLSCRRLAKESGDQRSVEHRLLRSATEGFAVLPEPLASVKSTRGGTRVRDF